MIGVGIDLMSLAVRSGSPPLPPESVLRTPKGVRRNEDSISPDFLSIVNLPLAPNSDLLVFVASDYYGAEVASFKWGPDGRKVDLSQIAWTYFNNDESDLRVWHLHDAAGGAGCLELQYGQEYPTVAVLAAVQYQGLPVPALDRSVWACGPSSPAADSGLTLETTQGHELVIGAIAMAGPQADLAGGWQAGLRGRQRVGNIILRGGGMDVVLHEGYAIVQQQGQYRARKSGMTARPWGAICLTLMAAA